MGEEQLIDAIPLSEIKNIESVGSNPMDRKERQTASSQHLLSDLQNVSAPSEGMRSANCWILVPLPANTRAMPEWIQVWTGIAASYWDRYFRQSDIHVKKSDVSSVAQNTSLNRHTNRRYELYAEHT